jgi:hypothetical protein
MGHDLDLKPPHMHSKNDICLLMIILMFLRDFTHQGWFLGT